MINSQKLKAKMTETCFTQRKLAKVVGIDPSTLNRKINNSDGKTLTVKEAKIIADALGIKNPTEYFFC